MSLYQFDIYKTWVISTDIARPLHDILFFLCVEESILLKRLKD